jgi:hypothetical protein
MVFGAILLAATVCSVVGSIKGHNNWQDAGFGLFAIALLFFIVTMFTTYLYTTTETQPVSGVQVIDDKVYYTQSDTRRGWVKLNDVSFAPNTLSLGEAVLIKTCYANPLWLSVPLTTCHYRMYADNIDVGP